MAGLMRGIEGQISSENAAGTMTMLRYEELLGRGKSYEMAHRVLLGAGIGAVAVGAAIATWNWTRDRSNSGLALTIQYDAQTPSVGLSGHW